MKDYASSFKKNFIRSVSQGYLHLTIMPTEQCNFRCVYCYEDFEIGKMSADTVIGIKNLLSKAAPSLKQLKIDWFGGEPTLNKKAIVEISEHIIALQKHFEFSYKAHMTTNGFLLDLSMFTRFVALGIDDYQITLDGEKDVHDTTRLQMNGKGSFDVIWNNLKDYKQYSGQFDVAMRLHVSANNAESMWNLCQRIKAEFGHDKRFHINVEEIKNLGKGVETADPAAYVATDAKARVAELVAMMSTDIKEKKFKDRSDKHNPYVCYAAMPRQLMIRADGSIGKCTVMLKDDRNNLGKLNSDGTYVLDGEKLEIWTRGFISLDEREIGCPANKLPKLQPAVEKFNRDIEVVEVA